MNKTYRTKKCYSLVRDDNVEFTLNFLMTKVRDLLMSKGRAYNPGTEDRLSHFYRQSEISGLAPQQVWTVYFLKHVTAILSIMQDGHSGGEDIESRMSDLIGYGVLGVLLYRSLEQSAGEEEEVLDVGN